MEFTLLLHEIDGRVCVRSKLGQGVQSECMLGTVAHGDGSAQVWAGFLYSRRTELVVCPGNVNVDSYRRVL